MSTELKGGPVWMNCESDRRIWLDYNEAAREYAVEIQTREPRVDWYRHDDYARIRSGYNDHPPLLNSVLAVGPRVRLIPPFAVSSEDLPFEALRAVLTQKVLVMISEADRHYRNGGAAIQRVFDNSFDLWGNKHDGGFCAYVLRACPDSAAVWGRLDAIEATWCDIVSHSTEQKIEELKGWLDRAIKSGFKPEDLLILFADAGTIDKARQSVDLLIDGPQDE
jgi:hypothetical protein